MKHKIFKPFDKVLVRHNNEWKIEFYSHYNAERNSHTVTTGTGIADEDIIPYEGCEYLLGTSNNPKGSINFKEGDLGIFFDNLENFSLKKYFGFVGVFSGISSLNRFITIDTLRWNFVIPFHEFDPYNMEETEKHILCVKNGKVVRYKD